MNINPAALTPQQLAVVLTKAGGKISEADVQRDVKDGAPANADGTLHLVHYTAWLATQIN